MTESEREALNHQRIRWRDFAKEKPEYFEAEYATIGEYDPEYCWVIYRYTDRPPSMSSGPFLSTTPVPCVEDVFTGYGKESPYPEDWTEVLYWCPVEECEQCILQEFKNFHRSAEDGS